MMQERGEATPCSTIFSLILNYRFLFWPSDLGEKLNETPALYDVKLPHKSVS